MLEKQLVIAQTLYFMSVHDKTQNKYLLLPKRKKEMQKRLAMYEQLIDWLCSDQPLPLNEMELLLEYIHRHPHIFPPIEENIRKLLTETQQPIECRPGKSEELRRITLRMQELISCQKKQLARMTAINNHSWIICFHAFHNLPRFFFSQEYHGLWNISLSPLPSCLAIQYSTSMSIK